MLVSFGELQLSDLQQTLSTIEQQYQLTGENYDYLAAIARKLQLNTISYQCLEQGILQSMNTSRIDLSALAKRYRTLLSAQNNPDEMYVIH